MSLDPKTDLANPLYTEIFDFLDTIAKSDSEIRFTVRKSDLGSKLQRGFWFYGNNKYIALSFNYGFDYVNNTPNIALIIDLVNLNHYLLLSARDDEKKGAVIQEYIVPLFRQEQYEKNYMGQYIIPFGEKDLKKLIKSYLYGYGKQIRDIIEENENEFEDASDSDINSIRLIHQNDFTKGLEKIYIYKNVHSIIGKSSRIKKFEINYYEPIKALNSGDIPDTCNFIFLTGKNGTGKTSILKALATALCVNKDGDTDLSQNNKNPYSIILTIEEDGYYRKHNVNPFREVDELSFLVKGFAAYGASRLVINNRGGRPTTNINGSDLTMLTYSIFYPDGVLHDIGKKIVEWKKQLQNERMQSRVEHIIKTLTRICQPGLKNIYIKDDTTYYIELDEEGFDFNSVQFEELASGIKSIIAMFGDMMIRLFDQQNDKDDPAELIGVVLIDEIDIHLHPALQKDIVQKLEAVFPRIQFFITTHSPIPLLGAPKNSLFYRVSRTVKKGVVLEKFDDLKISSLMPNAIFSSPLFGLKDLTSSQEISHSSIRTEDSWEEILLNDKRKREIKDILDSLDK